MKKKTEQIKKQPEHTQAEEQNELNMDQMEQVSGGQQHNDIPPWMLDKDS